MVKSIFIKGILLVAGCCFSLLVIAQQVSLDNQVLLEFMEHRGHEPTEFQQFLSNSTNYISLAVPATILTVGIISNDKHTVNKGLYIGETLVLSSLVTFGLKYSINRPRPSAINNRIVPEGTAGSPSFPSGHTSEAFATATSLLIAYPKWYVIVPAYCWAGSVAVSRMYLGVHYPTDIIGGVIVGAGSAWLTYKLNRWLQGGKQNHLKKTGNLF